jgi:hypothetical protein
LKPHIHILPYQGLEQGFCHPSNNQTLCSHSHNLLLKLSVSSVRREKERRQKCLEYVKVFYKKCFPTAQKGLIWLKITVYTTLTWI